MKILFLLLLSIPAFAQDYRVIKNISDLRKSIAVTDGTVAYVLGYRTNGDGGGGIYVYSDTSTATDDGGAIIKSTGQGAWIHEVKDKVVNLKWWGIRPLSATGTSYNLAQDDIAQEFKAALKFINERAKGAELYIEAGEGGVWQNGTYYSSETWLLDKPGIVITGTKSPIGKPSTKITWDAQKLCINVTEPAKSVTLENFEVTQINNGFNWGDSTGHGIYSRSTIYAFNLSFLNLAGNAIHLEACAIVGDPVFGNADHSVLQDIWINYTNHGLYMKGCDVNKVSINNLQASNVRRWGVYDDSFLGNDYTKPHFAYAGFAGNNNPTTVQYKGKAYITRYQVLDQFVNKGYEPDKHPEIWFEYWTSGYAPEWEPTKRYWSAGTIAAINDNAVHTIIGMYTEDGQAPGFLSTRSRLLDGTRGTATFGGVQERAMFGTNYHNANNVFPGVLVGNGGYEFPQAPIHAVQDFAKSGMLDIAKFESVGNAAWVKIKNSVGEGYINLQDNTLKLHSADGNTFGVDAGGIYVKSLGVSTDNDVVTYNRNTGKFGHRPYNGNGSGGGVSQSDFDALLTRVNSLDAILATKASKDELRAVSDALAALTVRVNNLPTGNQPNPQLTQILGQLSEVLPQLQDIINRLNEFKK